MPEVLLDVWRSASRYDQARGTATAWLLPLAHRRAVDRARSRAKISRTGDAYCIAADPHNHVTEAAKARLDRDQVGRCLSLLAQLQRESRTVSYCGGYAYREVAELLGVSAGMVTTRRRDGLIRLRESLRAG